MADEPTPKRLILINQNTVPPGGFRYIQPESGKHFSASSFRAMANNVLAHRRANGFPIGTDFEAELQDWLCRKIPDAGMHCYERGKSFSLRADGARVGTGYDGSAKWRELHLYALTERPTQMDRVAWLANFANSLPCGECKRDWKVLTRQHPLRQNASDDEFFRWTVDRHNDVNDKLGKPILDYETARAIYLQ